MRRRKHKTTVEPRTGPCDACGQRVELPADEPGWRPSTDDWKRCSVCRHAPRAQQVAAVLAAVGIEADADDAAVELALSRLPWQAAHHPAMSEALLTSFPGQMGPAQTASGRTGSNVVGSLPLNGGNDQPWEHLDPRTVRAAIDCARAQLADEVTPKPCTEAAACAGCGVNRSIEWLRYNVSTPTGGPMVLCAECSRLWERAGESFYGGDWETLLCAAALGVQATMGLGEQYHFRAYHDVPDADPHGSPVRFAYVPAETLDAARRHVWRRFPLQAPPAMQARMRRADEARARLAASRPTPPAPPLTVPGVTTPDQQP